jgi:geranylgeranyl diphosphate synthase type II
LYEFGLNLGLAFQLQDDLLDSFGDQKIFGKRIGGDILANKKTFLLINALENAPHDLSTELLSWVNKTEYDAKEKIDAIKKIYMELKIKELTQQKIDFYFQKSSQILQNLSVDEGKKQALVLLSGEMLNRNY